MLRPKCVRRCNAKEIDEVVWVHDFHKASKLYHAALVFFMSCVSIRMSIIPTALSMRFRSFLFRCFFFVFCPVPLLDWLSFPTDWLSFPDVLWVAGITQFLARQMKVIENVPRRTSIYQADQFTFFSSAHWSTKLPSARIRWFGRPTLQFCLVQTPSEYSILRALGVYILS